MNWTLALAISLLAVLVTGCSSQANALLLRDRARSSEQLARDRARASEEQAELNRQREARLERQRSMLSLVAQVEAQNYPARETSALAAQFAQWVIDGGNTPDDIALQDHIVAALNASAERNPGDKALLLASLAYLYASLGAPTEAAATFATSFEVRPTLIVTLWLINGLGARDRPLLERTCQRARQAISDPDEVFELLASCESETHALDLDSALEWTTAADRLWFKQVVKSRQAELVRQKEDQARLYREYLLLRSAQRQADFSGRQAEASERQAEAAEHLAKTQARSLWLQEFWRSFAMMSGRR